VWVANLPTWWFHLNSSGPVTKDQNDVNKMGDSKRSKSKILMFMNSETLQYYIVKYKDVQMHYCGRNFDMCGRCAVLFIEKIAGKVIRLHGIVMQGFMIFLQYPKYVEIRCLTGP
jgi:hypothetical protein